MFEGICYAIGFISGLFFGIIILHEFFKRGVREIQEQIFERGRAYGRKEAEEKKDISY
jgi:hypothetical protein